MGVGWRVRLPARDTLKPLSPHVKPINRRPSLSERWPFVRIEALGYGVGVLNCTAEDCESCDGGGGGATAFVVIVNAFVHVDTAPSVSVAVKETEPETGPVEAATPVTTAVTPSGFRTTVAEGSENVYVAALYVAPDGVVPSAR